jgi:hypothetical protein
MTSFRPQFGSTKASKTLFVMVRGSMKVSELLPCGSRSIRQGGLAAKGEAAGQVDGRGRLADAALLVRDRDDHRRRGL